MLLQGISIGTAADENVSLPSKGAPRPSVCVPPKPSPNAVRRCPTPQHLFSERCLCRKAANQGKLPVILRRAASPVPRRALSFAALALRVGRRKPLGGAAFAVLLLMVLVAAFADIIATHDPVVQDIPSRLRPPGTEHYFGTDSFGRDTFSRVIHGTRLSLYVGVASVCLSLVLGTVLGILSAYIGGRTDLMFQRLIDALLAFPSLILVLLLVTALGPSVNNVVIAVVIAITPQLVRIARSQALSVTQETYVLAARATGAPVSRVVLRHILPNSLTPVVVQATGYAEQAIFAEAALSFLGLGVPPPTPSWGRLLHEGAFGFLEAAPWLTLFPGLALSVTVFAFALLGDALRDILDPRLVIRGHQPRRGLAPRD